MPRESTALAPAMTAALLLSALACGASVELTGELSAGLSGETSSAATTAAATSEGSSTSAAASAGSTSSGDAMTSVASDAMTTTGALQDDLGAPDTDTGPIAPACNGKIDVVFVLAPSDYEYYAQAMPGSLPAFVDTMTTTLADFDLHVMVLDSDGAWGSPNLCPKSKCPADGGCPEFPDDPSFPCWALHDADALTKCDDTRGAGVTFPAGEGASNVRCPLAGGRRFLTSDDPDFADNFHCVANLGVADGWDEGPHSLMRALSDDLGYGCNAGFLRDDALLLVLLVSVQDYSEYSPPVWANAVLEAKGGDQDKIVVMALSSDRSADEPICPGPKVDEPHAIFQFAMLFEHGLMGSFCADNYGPYFDEAATLAAELCGAGPQG
ncbi:MAG: hypothetical protein R3A79_10690 [Nannocystaceae bacterium]